MTDLMACSSSCDRVEIHKIDIPRMERENGTEELEGPPKEIFARKKNRNRQNQSETTARMTKNGEIKKTCRKME